MNVRPTWRDFATDPNDEPALAYRSSQLSGRRRESNRGRAEWLVERCRGAHVLHLGCVAHSPERMQQPTWLHGQIDAAASRTIGVDLDAEGVEWMRKMGFEAVVGDVTQPFDRLSLPPSEIVVAGEIIEHLGSPEELLRFCRDAVTPSGKIFLTTPNPFAPWRVRRAQLDRHRDNVDHVTLISPAGLAEMCDRVGLRIVEYVALGRPRLPTVKAMYYPARRSVERARRRPTTPLPASYVGLADLAPILLRRGWSRTGETLAFMLEHVSDGGEHP